MVQLGEDLRIVLVDVVGDLLEARDDLGVVDVDQLLVGHVRRVNAHLLGDDEPGAPLGTLAPVVHLPFAG